MRSLRLSESKLEIDKHNEAKRLHANLRIAIGKFEKELKIVRVFFGEQIDEIYENWKITYEDKVPKTDGKLLSELEQNLGFVNLICISKTKEDQKKLMKIYQEEQSKSVPIIENYSKELAEKLPVLIDKVIDTLIKI
ncbi:hypothetical protein [Dethiosulfovibrio peptidovorans]|uniref:hypothetical protein n=1 Tax=Dethiosulfovibrio peptidovorans TaxID=47055 RepID=UPI00019E63B1|nr:hypothetical protein [Dethiosulfovibrio peptidovorans]